MYLVQLLLPLYTKLGRKFDPNVYTEVRGELVNRFGGITAHTRAPVHGLWQESEEIIRDDLIIYEIMVEILEVEWWETYRRILETRFQQQSLVVRAHQIIVL